jgi:hypothetical protein
MKIPYHESSPTFALATVALFPAELQRLRHNVQTGSGAHSASRTVGAGGLG